MRKIFQSRRTLGEYHALVNEMKLGDHQSFYKYFHMTPQCFSHLLVLVGPSIKQQDTSFCQALPLGERSILLWYLVTGDSMQTISFSYRVCDSTSTIHVMPYGMCCSPSTCPDLLHLQSGNV